MHCKCKAVVKAIPSTPAKIIASNVRLVGDLSNYVPISRTIAGIDLADNITTNELQTALEIETLIGSSAPTTSTVGRVGQLYKDITNNKLYICDAVATENNVMTYTWIQLIRVTDRGGYGTNGVFGVPGVPDVYGINFMDYGDARLLIVQPATTANITARSERAPITPTNLNHAVKSALSDANHLTMTAAEQALAKSVLGVTTIKTSMDATATVNTQYYLGSQSTVTITLPSTANAGDIITVDFTSGSTATTLSITNNNVAGDTSFAPEANKLVEINFKYDGTYWKMLTSSLDIPSGV